MPLYDRRCSCGWTAIDVWESVSVPEHACPDCGLQTERAWLTKFAAVVGDECDFVQTNGLKFPRRFQSKQEFKRWLKDNHYAVHDTHRGQDGSDKSPFTKSWAQAYDPVTAENVKILLERAFLQPAGREEPPLNMRITSELRNATAEDLKAFHGR